MAKQVMAVTIVIPLNDVDENVLAGQRFERMPYNGFVTLLETGSAIGLESELNIGGQSISAPMPVNIQNRVPVTPDDLSIADAEAWMGQLLQLRVRNTTAGNLTYNARLVLEEAEGVVLE